MKHQVFVSYRRSDSEAEVSMIVERLRRRLGTHAVFLDRISIEAGELWSPALDGALRSAAVVIAVIGPGWLCTRDDLWGQRRIDQDDDVVRQELAAALRSRSKTVIPVYIRGAPQVPRAALPPPLAKLSAINSFPLSDIRPTSSQLEELTTLVAKSLPKQPKESTYRAPACRRLTASEVRSALDTDLSNWNCHRGSPPNGAHSPTRELRRTLVFSSFQDVVRFLVCVAPQCELMQHHPYWSNRWRTLELRLTTWRLDFDLSDLDLALARIVNREYTEFMETHRNQPLGDA